MGSRVAAITVFLAVALAPAAGAAEPLLPDLAQETPHQLGVVTDGKRFHLGFKSIIYNYGDGPLRILGTRASTSDPTMTATQVIDQSDGSKQRVERIGELRYVDAVTHRHWHYLKIDTYSLRRTNGTLARPDQKTGFCLGDRLRAPAVGAPPAGHANEYGATDCGYDRPDLLEVEEGISPGYGDDYGPQLEGQFVDITRLPAGRYQLVHRANANGAVREKTLDNNAASVLIDVRWRRSMPRVTQVARCPLSATCPVAPELTEARALRLARSGLRKAFGVVQPEGLTCGPPVRSQAACSFSRGTVTVGYKLSRGRVFSTYYAQQSGGGESVRGRDELSLGRARRVPVERQSSFAPRSAQRGRVGYCPLIARG